MVSRTRYARFLRRLAAFSRLIHFDKRGTGLSDRVAGIASATERMDDLRAVMDAAGSARAVLVGSSEGGPLTSGSALDGERPGRPNPYQDSVPSPYFP